jgi:hypothetical protein
MICNRCGADCDVEVSTDGRKNCCGEKYDYIGCYGSYLLKDMTKYEWCLCEKCLWHHFQNFKIPPKETPV